MERAVEIGASDLLDLHRVLMLATTTPEFAGRLRDRQNWIGGYAYNSGRAEFVPPPPELVNPLMAALVAFVNRTDLSHPGTFPLSASRSPPMRRRTWPA